MTLKFGMNINNTLRAFYHASINLFKKPIDVCLLPFVIICGLVLKGYRKIGSYRLPFSTFALKRIGIFPIINHYYEPLFDDRLLHKDLSSPRFLPGIKQNTSKQLTFLRGLHFSNELLKLKWMEKKVNELDFAIPNETFGPGDADFLYQFTRKIQPKKVIEIGSGNSTKIIHAALKKNYLENRIKFSHSCIEPYEMDWLERLQGPKVIRKTIQACNLNWKKELKAGDFLFIDSSHIIRPQGDVLVEFLEIIPQLQSGVYIHIHDIFSPRDYPSIWIIDGVKFWNEQYILEALLSCSDRFEIVAGLNFLKHSYFKELKKCCPYLEECHEPGSFYIRVR